MRLLLPSLAADGIVPDMAIVGEPTGMQPAIAERGLVVLDCVTRGITGHAARPEGVNAIYRAIDDISLLRGFRFGNESETLGPVRISVTMIEAGRQHNVVPDECRWVADIRTTDAYSNEETVRILQEAVSRHSVLTPRSTRIRASVIDPGHPLVRAASEMGLTPFILPHHLRHVADARHTIAQDRSGGFRPLPLRRRVHSHRRDRAGDIVISETNKKMFK